MKFKYILLIFALIFIVSARKTKKTRRHHLKKEDSSNVYVKYCQGIVDQLGGDPKDIDACIPGEYKSSKSEDAKLCLPSFTNAKDIFMFIYKTLGVSMDVACKFKSNVKDFFKKKAGVRRYRRVFVHLENVHHRSNPFDDMSEKTREIYQKFKEVFECPLSKKIDEFLACLKTAKSSQAKPGIINVINNFQKTRANFLKDLSAFVDVYVEMACYWKQFKDALIFFKNGIASTDVLAQYNKLGQFYGRIVHIIGMSS